MERKDDKEIAELKKVVDGHSELLTDIQQTLKSMDEKLKPISETYLTVTTLGKWVTAGMVFISLVIGIIVGWQKIISK